MSYDMIDRFLRNNLGDDDYAEYSAALDSLCTPQPKQEQGEPEMVRNMRMWVTALKSVSDNGQHMKIPSGLSSGTCWELAIALEKFIDTTPQSKQEQGEPVALNRDGIRKLMNQAGYDNANPQEAAAFISGIRHREAKMLDTTPQQRKPLTVDQVWLDDDIMKLNAVMMLPMDYFMRVIRAIEAAHGIKE
jgi:hypothetical protein